MGGEASINHQHNKLEYDKLKLGDRIQFKRRFYSHWGIYIGGDCVIHMRGVGNAPVNSAFTDIDGVYGIQFDKAEVAIDKIQDVINNDEAYVNNSRDSTWKARDEGDIISSAMKLRGRIKYNIIFANCECFVNWCRYGKWLSDQVAGVALILKAVRTTLVKYFVPILMKILNTALTLSHFVIK
ncbi:Phospholipase A and acyltransferase 3 [Bulinus truncatus]|nr:Phospholipase A and acyltransferase 3 [Bulinus truncatus]